MIWWVLFFCKIIDFQIFMIAVAVIPTAAQERSEDIITVSFCLTLPACLSVTSFAKSSSNCFAYKPLPKVFVQVSPTEVGLIITRTAYFFIR